MRAYVFWFAGKDDTKCSVTVDLIDNPGCSLEQATMNAITSVIEAKGSNWIKDYETQIVE